MVVVRFFSLTVLLFYIFTVYTPWEFCVYLRRPRQLHRIIFPQVSEISCWDPEHLARHPQQIKVKCSYRENLLLKQVQ